MRQAIVLCGLHAAGKSFHCQRLVERFGYHALDKRQVLRSLYTRRESGTEWEEWYMRRYKDVGARQTMEEILDAFDLSDDERPIAIDSVHNVEEWRAVAVRYRAILVLISTPTDERFRRWNKSSESPAQLDHRRIQFGHTVDECGIACLFSLAEWTLPGAVDETLALANLQALHEWLHKPLAN